MRYLCCSDGSYGLRIQEVSGQDCECLIWFTKGRGPSKGSSFYFRDKNMLLYGTKKRKEIIIMMDFVLLMVAIYIALVGASLTMLVLVCSKWYVSKIKKMTKDMIEDMDLE